MSAGGAVLMEISKIMAFFSSTLNKVQKGNIEKDFIFVKKKLFNPIFFLLQALQIHPKMCVHLRVYCLYTSRKNPF